VSDFDLVIRGGRIVTAADDVRCDVGIAGGRIAALGAGLPEGCDEIDADGLMVLPGGVDSHCHMDQPMFGGARTADDFLSGTRSALCGGTTTVMPFAYQIKGQSLRTAEGKAMADYAIHLVVSDPTPQTLGQELPALIADGYTSFKIYLTYEELRLDDREVLDVLDLARREGAMVMVHAENDQAIGWLTERLLLTGKTTPRYLADSRPSVVVREATHPANALSEIVDVPILIVHVSGREAAEQIRSAQTAGLRIYGETCPQYLFLTAEDLAVPGFEATKYMCCPPPRDGANQEAIWIGLANGTFQVFSSDHSPYRFAGADGKKVHGTDAPFTRIPAGVPGLETRLPLLFSEGVGKGRIDLNRFVDLTATTPAKIYGLYPRKGTIAVGADADIAIWDPDKRVTIANSLLHHAVDYTPYEGMAVKGWPVRVLSRGETVFFDGHLFAEPGRGCFLACGRPTPARPRSRTEPPGRPS
jgi:dihydropyrimidinase